jgi:transcription-repair coupling factor (superfamily II helicase)
VTQAPEAWSGWGELAEYRGLADLVRRGVGELELSGLPAAAAVLLGLALRRDLGRPLVLLCADWSVAASAAEAAAAWSGSEQAVLSFPPREFLPYALVAQGPEIHARRLATLTALARVPEEPPILVLPVSALRRQLPPPDVFRAAVLTLAVGQRHDPGALAAALARAGYERQPLVEGPGSFALRGGILDVYPLTAEQPLRLEFEDDRLVSLRTFSAETQRSAEAVPSAVVPPAREVPAPEGPRVAEAVARIRASLQALVSRLPAEEAEVRQRLEEGVGEAAEGLAAGTAAGLWENYLPFAYPPTSVLAHLRAAHRRPPLCLVLDAADALQAALELARHDESRLAGFLSEGRVLPEQAAAFGLPLDWRLDLGGGTVVYVDALGRGLPGVQSAERMAIPGRQAPPFAGQWTLALDEIRRWTRGGYRVLCWLGGTERAASVARELRDAGLQAVEQGPPGSGQVGVVVGQLPAGFEVPGLRLAVLTERELFGRRPRPARVRRASPGARLQSYEDLQVGDYVVHTTHGIGQYLGTTTLTVQGKRRDYLVLRYEGTDRLYVPTDQIGLVQKYIGGEGRAPKVSRLGGGEWARVKQRVKESVRHMAEELLALYAARQTLRGHAFAPDTPWQREFEDAFPYEETPDQLAAIAEIKADMERPVPMDRLLCGDVGYGKTEVAMRAAFKAVADNRQVAVLVPTTILAEQHYLTFTERFRGFPVKIGMLSRFRNRKEQEETITGLRRGEVDIVIGTHRLLQDDVDFKNLGLLIVDEEHRFGVAHKERLKQLRQTVDVLTMTATPIPRTLHMALAGIRDMSTITTPPENRYPVETVVVEWSPTLVREAISRELARGGQVFYLHNRVQSIHEAYERLRALAPDADIVIAHGQMPEDELEAVMTEFWRGEHQILLSTTIIESGLDIPNANTLIVEDADKLGLAQLYQIRGRVGRSSRVAYAYLTYRKDRSLSEMAAKRLEALKEFTELGSGFKIALRDLEIRGAGNLLGPEQHGHVAAVGFDLYAQLLEEAVRELRGERQAPATRPTVELRVDAFIEDAYIAEPRVKLEFYKKVHAAASEADVRAVEEELRDRFGPYPAGVGNLLRLARIRVAAQELGLLGVVQEGRAVTFTFPNYASGLLARLGDLPARLGRRLRLRPSPRPLAELSLDGLDDATVLASVEACLQALAAHPEVRRWQATLAEATEAGRPEQAGDVEVTPAPAEPGPAPLASPSRAGEGSAADDRAGERAAQERLARAHGLRPVEAPPPAATPRPRPPAVPPPGRPVRATLPPGVALPPRPGAGAAGAGRGRR